MNTKPHALSAAWVLLTVTAAIATHASGTASGMTRELQSIVQQVRERNARAGTVRYECRQQRIVTKRKITLCLDGSRLAELSQTVPSEGRNGTGSLGRTWSVKGRVTRRLSGLGMFGSEPA